MQNGFLSSLVLTALNANFTWVGRSACVFVKQFFRHKWITRVKDSRAVKLTPSGKDMLTDLGVSLT